MGLKEKQAIHDLLEKDIPKYEARLRDQGLTISMQIVWEHVPQNEMGPIERCKTILSDFTTLFWQFSQDKVAKAEIEKRVKAVNVSHDSSKTGEYDYSLKFNGTTLEFSANLEKFTFTQSSSKQKCLKDTLGELL